jgi:ribosomal protein L37E
VTDVGWNPKQHVIAVCGFGNDYPVLVYKWEKKEEIG